MKGYSSHNQKRPESNLIRILGMNNIPLLASQQIVLAKQSSISAANDPVLLDPAKTKIMSYLAKKRTCLADGESTSKIF